MINSILQHKPCRINLDHLYYQDPVTSDSIFTNNPKIIEREAIKHFQTNASNPHHTQSYDSIYDLPLLGKSYMIQQHAT